MAITQDTIVTVGSGATEKSFGVSKTLDQYTLDDLKTVGDWAYSAYNDNIYNANLFKVIDRTGTLINIEDTESSIRLTTLSPNQLFTEGYNLQSEGVFFRNVLVYWETGTVTDWSSHTIFYGSTSLESKRIVTDIELQDLKIAISYTDINAYNSTYTTCKLGVNDVAICPMQLLVTPDNVYLNMALPFNGGRGTAGNMNSWLTYQLISYDNPTIKTYTDYKNLRTIDGALTDTLYMAPNGIDFALENGKQNKTFTSADSLVSMDSYEWGGYRFFRYQLNQSNLDAPYIWHAYAGVKFELDSVTYKPIVSNGMITGYTDDMSEESEWDTWENIKDHVTPSVRPTPTPTPSDAWDVDSETYGWGGNEVGGMVRYYLLTSTEMDNLVSAMGSSANWVIDYLNNIVSCFIVPNDGLFFDAAVPTTVKFRVDNNHEWDTGVSCKRIIGVVNKSGGTIEIPRCTNTFLDFEPYSDYSIYIPFCGRVPIKGNIVCGREVTVTYYPDVPTCSLTAVVTCGNSTVAIAKGQYGSMIPVTSSGADRKTAAAISDVSSIITGLGVGIAGAATGNAGLLIAGGSQLVGGFLNAAKDTVQSYAYSSGSSGDTSFFAAGTRCQYYANYLQLDDVVNSSEFGHTIGYLCKEIGKLSSYHGFTICANPHVHISATSTEKEEIKRLLEEGVILP